MSGIGLLNEKPLHAALKQWYARPGDQFEVAVGRFVIDLVRDDLLVEIQTGSFASIKSKLTHLVRSHHVRLIYPIIQEKWIIRPAIHDRRRIIRRKSPKRGRLEDLFWEMVNISHLLPHPNLSVEVLLIRVEESRHYAGSRLWRTGGWAVASRRLLEVVDRRLFRESMDWRRFLPEGVQSFTTKELAAALQTRRELAQKMAYTLRQGRVIELIGKRERGNLYRVVGA